MGPLLTSAVVAELRGAAEARIAHVRCSLDLGRSTTEVEVGATEWTWRGLAYPHLVRCKERTIYYWDGDAFQPAARFVDAHIKLVPTEWGVPTFEIDGIKMLPSADGSPYEDAARKVAFVEPAGKRVLDTCGGLGYFAAWSLEYGATEVLSFERSAEVLWLRSLNPWSPPPQPRLRLTHGDCTGPVAALPSGSVDAILHDPPRFGIAGELYSSALYQQFARVLGRRGRLFHYTGAPNSRSRGRDLAAEVATRLRAAGFVTEPTSDGVVGIKR